MANNKWKTKLQDLYSKTVLLILGIVFLLLISIVAPYLGYDGGGDSADLIWWLFWAVAWVVGIFSIVCGIYVVISRHIRSLRNNQRKD
jgi:O-antigen/teichoic acid export membrane protein